jgi:predicted phosphoadenosine phosphosulfate sulfurtransferase
MPARPKRPITGAGLRIYSAQSVVDAAYERIEWIMREFGRQVVVRVSGGKDSTVILAIALAVARELDLLPLKVYWLDQEAEWDSTVEIVREWMYRDEVEPLWLQVPFRIFNASSQYDHWLKAWDPDAADRWIHERDPIALTENVYGTDRFVKLFGASLAYHLGERPAASIAGVRCEESPNRRKGLTHHTSYKWVTWGNVEDKKLGHYTFYPIFDWHYRDVWKFIFERGLRYSTHYDTLYRAGIDVRHMRVSNLHHETAVNSLFQLQEFEPDTYDRLVARIGGIDMAGKLGAADYFPSELPFMFEDWRDYRDYLLAELVDAEYRPFLAKLFNETDRKLPASVLAESYRIGVRSILTCDWEGVKYGNWRQSPHIYHLLRDNRPHWKTVEEVPIQA